MDVLGKYLHSRRYPEAVALRNDQIYAGRQVLEGHYGENKQKTFGY